VTIEYRKVNVGFDLESRLYYVCDAKTVEQHRLQFQRLKLFPQAVSGFDLHLSGIN